MVWSCKQNALGKVSQTSFTCESKREKACGTNTLATLHWGFWMEPLGASTKRNVGGGDRPWCVAAQSWAAAPATLTDMSGHWKKKKKHLRKEKNEFIFILRLSLSNWLLFADETAISSLELFLFRLSPHTQTTPVMLHLKLGSISWPY